MDFDPELSHDITNFYMGDFENDYCNLEQSPPVENIFPDSHYSLKKRASLDYDITKYPIRTSVKLFRTAGDSIRSLCSGSIISRRYVLTARHCVAMVGADSLIVDSILVCPIVDNGEPNPYFDCSWVSKMYFFKYLDANESDIAVLEMEEPVGEKTGWISIGFNSNDDELLNGIFYKFS